MRVTRGKTARALYPFLVAAAVGPAVGQGTEELDAGTYEIRQNGRRVATESFAVRREGNVVRAVGRIVVEGSANGVRNFEVLMQTDARFRPNTFGLRAPSGSVTRVDGVWEGDRLRLHVSSDQGERWKEFLTPGAVAVLEPGVAHHYYLLFRQLGPSPDSRRIPVIVPSRNAREVATIRNGRTETLVLGGERVEARRYEVDVGGSQTIVWLDGEGRVLRVAYPGEGRIAVRIPDG